MWDYAKLIVLAAVALLAAIAANYAHDLPYMVNAVEVAIAAAITFIYVLRHVGEETPKTPNEYQDGVIRAGVIATAFWGIVGFCLLCAVVWLRKRIRRVVSSSRRVSFNGAAFPFQPSLSRNLTGVPAISACWSRLRRVLLELPKSSSAEAHSALSATCVFSDGSSSGMDAYAPRFRTDNHQDPHSKILRPRYGVTSRILTPPRALRGLGLHALNNLAARFLVACGPETQSSGGAVGHHI